jgi:dolichol-phosphate mannosyltransferase
VEAVIQKISIKPPAPHRPEQTEKMTKILVAVATYNEKENIERLLDAIFSAVEGIPAVDALVVDDNSPDGTGRLVDSYAQRNPRVKPYHRSGKLGLGSAVLEALRYAASHQYDYIVFLDADFSHPPEKIPALIRGMEDHDIMIGSRYIPGGGIEGWDFKRKFMSAGINLFSRIFLGIKAHDCSGNFRCLRVAKVSQIPHESIRSRGYSFQEEFLFRCQRIGCKIGETPIVFVNRKLGKSNLNRSEIVRSLWTLLVVAVRRG